jgi:hypothetical protein
MALQTISARLVETENNITRSGTGQIVDATVVNSGDVVLLTQQTTSAENGLYVAGSGTWARHTDFATNTQMLKGTTFFIEEGSPYNEGSEWFFSTSNPAPSGITVGATDLYFDRRSWPTPVLAGTGVDVEGGTVSLREQLDVQGIYVNPVVQYNSQGIAVDAASDLLPEGLLEGLRLKWLSTNSVEIGEGRAWIPGANSGEGAPIIVDFPITKSGLSLTAATWHYLYLWDNGGTPDVEVSTQVPASPYYGGAMVKGGPNNTTPDASPDETRRLIEAVYAPAVNTLRRFEDMGNGFMRWIADLNSTLRAGSSLTQTVGTDLDVSAFAPPFADGVDIAFFLVNSDNASTLFISAAGDGLMTSGGSESAGQLWVGVTSGTSRQQTSGPVAFAGSTVLRHRQTAVGASRSGNIDIMGYYRRLS